jgi:hypothetical protein
MLSDLRRELEPRRPTWFYLGGVVLFLLVAVQWFWGLPPAVSGGSSWLATVALAFAGYFLWMALRARRRHR